MPLRLAAGALSLVLGGGAAGLGGAAAQAVVTPGSDDQASLFKVSYDCHPAQNPCPGHAQVTDVPSPSGARRGRGRRPGRGPQGEAARAETASAGPGIITGMRVLLASEPSGAGRPNENFAVAVPGAVVLLDGAGYEPASGIGCSHGIAWYARTLGGLLAAGACDDRVPLAGLLGRGIEQISRMHSGTCDLSHPAPGASAGPGARSTTTRPPCSG